MRREELSPGMVVAVEEKRGANPVYYKATIVAVAEKKSTATSTIVEVQPDGEVGTRHVSNSKIPMLWEEHERDQRRRVHEQYLLDIGRRALEEERQRVMKRTVSAGFNTIEVSSEPDTGAVTVRFATWEQVLDELAAARKSRK